MPTVNYLWNPINDNIVREFDDDGNVIADYTTEPDLHGAVISEHRDDETHFHLSDGQGNTVALTDDQGNVTDTFAYTASGEVTERTGNTPTPYQYGGQHGYYTDQTTGEIMARQRDYEPARGRWLSVDPLLPDGQPHILNDNNWFGDRMTWMRNTYEYCDNNPVNRVDLRAPASRTTTQPGSALGAPVRIGVRQPATHLAAAKGGWPTQIDLDISATCLKDFSQAISAACSKIIDTTCLGTSEDGARFVDRMKVFCDGRFRLNVVCPSELGFIARRYCAKRPFCAFSFPYGSTIYLCPPIITRGCNPSCVILHELVHMTGDPLEIGPESCEEACFPGCSPNRNPLDCPGYRVIPEPPCVPGGIL